ncbi:hypothetical protein [Streptomyces vietnamensis]|uniref:Uncharacterized protein n=1 Tax=Streptomyces vietnamensis TaxID=362257 RepID=A0A0B5ILF7_9ACTN|nr:hypothetical protein SVTN_37900 [Streptomyces vietnamensis]
MKPRLVFSASGTIHLKQYTRQTPRWQRCEAEAPADFECATLKVPLDYSRPGGRTLDVAVSRIKATRPQKRRGVLLLDPGGPGGPDLDVPLYMASELPAEVKERYDLGLRAEPDPGGSPADRCGQTTGTWPAP